MMVIGLTGGIGSGKSAAADCFKQCGANVIDADQLARKVVEPGQPALGEIESEFGSEVISAQGGLQREVLATLVFSDQQKLQKLEEILHPYIHRLFVETLQLFPSDAVVIYDIPLLVEKNRINEFDSVVVVESSLANRLERLKARGMTESDILARMKVQATDEDRRLVADHILHNNGDLSDLLDQVRKLMNLFRGHE